MRFVIIADARRVIYTTAVSPNALEHAKRHGAVIEEVPTLRSDRCCCASMKKASRSQLTRTSPTGCRGDLHLRHNRPPKGVMLTHRNLLFIAAVSAKIRSLTPDDRLYGALPMSHAVGSFGRPSGRIAQRRDTLFGTAI